MSSGRRIALAAVIPEMGARGSGQLVVISSLAAYRGLPKSAAYCASKAAVSAFFESLRLDLRPRGIDVTIIHPGFIKTPPDSRPGRVDALPDGTRRCGEEDGAGDREAAKAVFLSVATRNHCSCGHDYADLDVRPDFTREFIQGISHFVTCPLSDLW